jgi:hypothetical protein
VPDIAEQAAISLSRHMRVTAYANAGDGLVLVGVEDFEHLARVAGLSPRLSVESLGGPALDADPLGQQQLSGLYRFRHRANHPWTDVQWTRQMGNLSTFDFTLSQDDVQIVSSVRLLRQEEAQPQDDDVHSVARLLRAAFGL